MVADWSSGMDDMDGIRHQDYYEVLGVPRDADSTAIRRAYRKRALQLHPDKNLDNPEKAKEAFRLLTVAFKTLDDQYLRKQYDTEGEEGVLKSNGFNGLYPDNEYATRLFERLFGPSGEIFGGHSSPSMRRGRDVQHVLQLSLEELYSGKTSKLALQKSVLCSKCNGVGGPEGAVTICGPCGGRGVVVRQCQVAPGLQQGMSETCKACNGEGEVIEEEDICDACMGRKVLVEKKVLLVNIERGMRNGQKVIFKGEGDQQRGVTPGDIIIVVQEKPHPVFQRDGNDLLVDMEISLVEALCGFNRTIHHLDGRVIAVGCPRGEVTPPGSVKCAHGEGMPVYKESAKRGKLMVTFHVRFPPNNFAPPEALAQLERLLPHSEQSDTDDGTITPPPVQQLVDDGEKTPVNNSEQQCRAQ